ncbi:hypothetical protein L3X38_024770 [Prunus dulcis]|uniref:DUF4371 domain-containing protein n=1 Tax=Prunus dulcis TaxID=3755 RepID=A0AAD4W362_PRUDU|nr:hypothetical protein L3X38_024770 [Prunus dulcis]
MNEKQHIENVFHKHSHESQIDYKIRLNAFVDCIRFLLRQGLAFRGHDESEDSSNQGNFLELFQFLDAPKNLKVTSPKIQKDIVNAAAVETTDAIIRDMDDAFFCILIDESCDVLVKQHMVVMFRYVDNKGCVIERFIGIEDVTSTTTESLKASIDILFSRHKLSMCRLRGQGYDGASNMIREFSGLKTLIMRENESAYYVHFSNVVNIVGASSKHRDILQDKQTLKVVEELKH